MDFLCVETMVTILVIFFYHLRLCTVEGRIELEVAPSIYALFIYYSDVVCMWFTCFEVVLMYNYCMVFALVDLTSL